MTFHWDQLGIFLQGAPPARWIAGLCLFALTIVILFALRGSLSKKLNRFALETKNIWDDVVIQALHKTNVLSILVAAIFLGSLTLKLDEGIARLIRTGTILVLLIQGAVWSQFAVKFFLDRILDKKMQQDVSSVPTLSFVGFIARVLIWVAALLIGLDNLGVNITTLLAGMGVGGVAIALASQKILEDVFCSLSIILDKPFVYGDFIVVDNLMGSIEHIGLKTTRIRSLTGEQIVFANSDLLSSRIRNFKRMWERRVVFTIGVVYETPREKLARIPGMIREIIAGQKDARFDRSHFMNFGDFSLNFETAYYVLAADYETYMDIQQEINLAIIDRFTQEGITFAYPTAVHYVKSTEQTLS